MGLFAFGQNGLQAIVAHKMDAKDSRRAIGHGRQMRSDVVDEKAGSRTDGKVSHCRTLGAGIADQGIAKAVGREIAASGKSLGVSDV